MVNLFAGLAEIFKARVIFYLLDGHRLHLFGDQACQPFVQSHSQRAYTLGTQSQRRRQNQIGAIGLQQVRRAHVHGKALGNQRDHIHQCFGRFAAFGGQITDFFQG